MSQFHFLRPEWFLLLIPLALLIWRLLRNELSAGSWRLACDPDLLPFLLSGEQTDQRRTRLVVVALSGLLATVALAGPVWTQLEQPLFRSTAPLIIALDLSRSMDAADIKPSRLTRARHKLSDILSVRKEGQTALLVYAAQPFVVTPLTDDTATIASQVNSLTTELAPSQGSRPDLAITKANELFRNGGTGKGDLLLISDGLGSLTAGELAADLPRGLRISILGLGTREGAPIPLPAGGFLKNSAGDIILPGLNEDQLKALAHASGGRYSRHTLDDSDISWLLEPLNSSQQNDMAHETDFQADRWREEGPWLLLLLLPVCALAFRRGYLVLLLFLTLPLPRQSHAVDWDTLWSRTDQQASNALERGEHEQAADLFENSEWKAAAQYRAGKYQESLTALDGLDTPRANYNRGNSLARLGRLSEAVSAYEKVLAQSDDQDARYNLEQVKKLLDKQNPEQQQQADGQEDRQSEKKSQQQDDQQSSDQNPTSEENQSDQNGSDEESSSDQANEPDKAGDAEQSEEKNRERNEQQNAENSAEEMNEESAEQALADEQWMRRIPDDPGGLLRRKFRYQYQRKYKGAGESQPW